MCRSAVAKKGALQARLAVLREEHETLVDLHKRQLAVNESGGGQTQSMGKMGGDLSKWAGKEVEGANAQGKSFLEKEAYAFMKYEKNNPYFDKVQTLLSNLIVISLLLVVRCRWMRMQFPSLRHLFAQPRAVVPSAWALTTVSLPLQSAQFTLQDDQEDGEEVSDSKGPAAAKQPSLGEAAGGKDEDTTSQKAKKEPRVDALVQLDRDFAKYDQAWNAVKTLHPHIGAAKAAREVSAVLARGGSTASHQKGPSGLLRHDISDAGSLVMAAGRGLEASLKHPLELDLPEMWGFESGDAGNGDHAKDEAKEVEATRGTDTKTVHQAHVAEVAKVSKAVKATDLYHFATMDVAKGAHAGNRETGKVDNKKRM